MSNTKGIATEPAKATFPAIDIPDDAWDKDAHYSFSLRTKHGHLKVETFGYQDMVIKGSVEALSDYELFRPEWAPNPDQPGKNKTRQTVILTDDGPQLFIGRFDRSQSNHNGYRFLTVVKCGGRFDVLMPLTEEQEKIRDQKRSEAREGRETEKKVQVADDWDREDWMHNLYRQERASFKLLEAAATSGRFRFTPEAWNRVTAAMDHLSTVLANGKVIEINQSAKKSCNVVQFSSTTERRATP